MYQGCDISAAQAGLTQDDFGKMVTSQSMSFCVIECMIGNDGKSSTFEQFKGYAVNAGLKMMPYNFAYAIPDDGIHPNRNAKDQATYHWANCNATTAVLDVEFPVVGDYAKWKIQNGSFIADWVDLYCATWKSLTAEFPIIYTYPDYMSQIGNPASFADYKLWIASYETTPTIPSPWTDWVMWQHNNKGVLPNGMPVDLDYCNDLCIFD